MLEIFSTMKESTSFIHFDLFSLIFVLYFDEGHCTRLSGLVLIFVTNTAPEILRLHTNCWYLYTTILPTAVEINQLLAAMLPFLKASVFSLIGRSIIKTRHENSPCKVIFVVQLYGSSFISCQLPIYWITSCFLSKPVQLIFFPHMVSQ